MDYKFFESSGIGFEYLVVEIYVCIGCRICNDLRLLLFLGFVIWVLGIFCFNDIYFVLIL